MVWGCRLVKRVASRWGASRQVGSLCDTELGVKLVRSIEDRLGGRERV